MYSLTTINNLDTFHQDRNNSEITLEDMSPG